MSAPAMTYRGYHLRREPWGWTAHHVFYGQETTAVPDGAHTVIVWRSRGALIRAIDHSHRTPARGSGARGRAGDLLPRAPLEDTP